MYHIAGQTWVDACKSAHTWWADKLTAHGISTLYNTTVGKYKSQVCNSQCIYKTLKKTELLG